MATSYNFDNKQITEPGAYVEIKSGIKNPPQAIIYGNILIIDTALGATWGGGSGIAGELLTNKNSIQKFTDMNEFREKIMGGPVWDLAKPLFYPKGYQTGVKQITYAGARTTTCATNTITFGLGSVIIKPRNEGLCGNGSLYKVSAKCIYSITHAGGNNDTIDLISDEGGIYPVTLGSHTCIGAESAIVIALALKVAVNILTGTHGYTAEVNGADVEVTAPTGTGVLGNAYVPSVSVTGVITATVPSFYSGGYTGGLTKGYASQMNASPNTSISAPIIFRIDFEVGTYVGANAQGIPYNNILEENCLPRILVTSPDFTTIPDLVAWMNKSSQFNKYFKLDSSAYQGSGTVTALDLTNNATLALFTGGTESYATSGIFDTTLDCLTAEYYNYVLCLESGINGTTGAIGTNNTKIWTHIKTIAKYFKCMVVGGGENENEFDSAGGSIDIAKYFNDEQVTCVHSGLKFINPNTGVETIKTSLYKASAYLGLKCGLQPENPCTFKSIDMDADCHEMTIKQQELATLYGVLTTVHDTDYAFPFTIKYDINTLQNNYFQINEDATCYGNNVVAIKMMVANTIVINSKKYLLSDSTNKKSNTRAILTPETVKNFVISQLKAMEGGLIIGYEAESITVTVKQDAYFINAGIYPNLDVSKLFYTVFLLDKNISI
jgi:hypothetical protein